MIGADIGPRQPALILSSQKGTSLTSEKGCKIRVLTLKKEDDDHLGIVHESRRLVVLG